MNFINKIILFGSYAKGTANKFSNIDIAAISNDFKEMNLLRRNVVLKPIFAIGNWNYFSGNLPLSPYIRAHDFASVL